MTAVIEHRDLTVKQRKFVKNKASGMHTVTAYRKAGYKGKSEVTARVRGSKLLKNPNVRQAFEEELIKQGITLEAIVKPVVNALRDDNIEIQLKGHDRALRMIMPKEDNTPTNINFFNIAGQEKNEFNL